MLKVKVNGGNAVLLDFEGNNVKLNDENFSPDVVQTPGGGYHLLLNNKSYRISIPEKTDNKHYTLNVNGNTYTIDIQDANDILLEKLGMSATGATKIKSLKAPMPGLVLDVLVTPGQEVKKDTPLLILEAMKMENILKAPGDGIISKILVQKKDAVEKGQELIIFQA